MPPGKLKLTIHNARDLRRVQELGIRDPYVTVQLGSSEFQSSIGQGDASNPVWNSDVSFNVQDEQMLHFILRSGSESSRDVLIGRADLSLAQVFADGRQEVQLDVLEGENKPNGKLNLSLKFESSQQSKATAPSSVPTSMETGNAPASAILFDGPAPPQYGVPSAPPTTQHSTEQRYYAPTGHLMPQQATPGYMTNLQPGFGQAPVGYPSGRPGFQHQQMQMTYTHEDQRPFSSQAPPGYPSGQASVQQQQMSMAYTHDVQRPSQTPPGYPTGQQLPGGFQHQQASAPPYVSSTQQQHQHAPPPSGYQYSQPHPGGYVQPQQQPHPGGYVQPQQHPPYVPSQPLYPAVQSASYARPVSYQSSQGVSPNFYPVSTQTPGAGHGKVGKTTVVYGGPVPAGMYYGGYGGGKYKKHKKHKKHKRGWFGRKRKKWW